MLRQSTVESPCVGLCELDPRTGFCRGCLRTGEEIGLWRDADDNQRRSVLRRIEARRAAGFATAGSIQPNAD